MSLLFSTSVLASVMLRRVSASAVSCSRARSASTRAFSVVATCCTSCSWFAPRCSMSCFLRFSSSSSVASSFSLMARSFSTARARRENMASSAFCCRPSRVGVWSAFSSSALGATRDT